MPPASKRLAALVAVSLLALPAPAQAIPVAAPQAERTTGTVVTLITGDRVLVTTGAAGRRSATVLPGAVTDPDGYLTRNFGNEVYVVPARAVPFLNAGRLDRRLFDVAGLADQGYDDERAAALPLIASEPLDGTTVTTELPFAGIVALSAEKKDLPQTWADFAAGSDSKLWLDGKVEPQMAESNAQIGSPAAWAAGFDGTGATVAVLDTGWDADHSDLAGKVIGARNFTGSNPDLVADANGHGTHVASTIAGTGAASNKAEQGVAPGAKLLIGKVLNPTGQDSWILAGMAWAVERGADVVNMSLGGRVGGDCNDVFSQAAQTLTEQSGTLFVMAAGNAGPNRGTVGSPGCVPGALTVGAVDSAGATAPFSSRGPIATQAGRLKPEISAPGVDVLAAQRGGGYVRMSGTSMASPHVAGVAALLSAKHPEWTAQQLKNVLISSTTPGAKDHALAQGAGVVDAARATAATVFGPGVVDAGSFAWPHEAQPKASTGVKLTNSGATAKTFALSLDTFVGEDGLPLKHDTVSLGATEVTVPAHGTAEFPVVVNPAVRQSDAGYGASAGRVIARSADGESVIVPVAFYLAPHEVQVTIKTADRRGQDPALGSFVDVVDLVRHTVVGFYQDLSGDIVLNLREGRYAISAFLAGREGGTTVKSMTYFADPDLVINRGDKAITLDYDARKATKREVAGDRPLEAQGTLLQNLRIWDGYYYRSAYSGGKYLDEVYAAESRPATLGHFEFGTYYRMTAPEIRMSVVDGPALAPEYLSSSINAGAFPTRLDGAGSAELAFAGAGSAAEMAAAGVAGKVALVRIGATSLNQVLANAAANRAVAVLVGNGSPGRWIASGAGSVPAMTITDPEEAALRQLLGAGPVRLSWQATALSPYVYNLGFVDDKKAMPVGTRRVSDRDLATVTEAFSAQRDSGMIQDGMSLYLPELGSIAGIGFFPVRTPHRRTAYYSPGVSFQHWTAGPGVFGETIFDLPRSYAAGQTRAEDWYRAPLRTSPTRRADLSQERLTERQADLIGAAVLPWGDGNPDRWSIGGFGDVGSMELFVDGASLGWSPFGSGVWQVPDGEHDFRLYTLNARINPGPPTHAGWNMFYRTETNNWFRSAKPSDNETHVLPVLLPTYELGVDDYNLAPASAGYHLRFGAVGQRDYTAGDLVAGKAWVSFDDGGTWTEVPVARDGAGFTATVDHTARSGKYVALRVDMTDSTGARVEQTIIRAYGIR